MIALAPHDDDDGEQRFIEQAIRSCQQQKANLTTIRLLVLRLLYRQPGGVKAYDLLDQLRALREGATAATVYRTLDFLIAHGLAHKIGHANQFIACRHNHHHHKASLFLACPQCQKITELHDEALSRMLDACLSHAGHQLVRPEIELGAICPQCQRDNKQP